MNCLFAKNQSLEILKQQRKFINYCDQLVNIFITVTKDSVTAAAEPLRSAALPAEEENVSNFLRITLEVQIVFQAVLSVPSSVDF